MKERYSEFQQVKYCGGIDKKNQNKDGLFFVAKRRQQIIGTVMAGYDGQRGWIYSIAVHPKHQKQGIGSELLLFAFTDNAPFLRECDYSFPGKISFYVKYGYAPGDAGVAHTRRRDENQRTINVLLHKQG